MSDPQETPEAHTHDCHVQLTDSFGCKVKGTQKQVRQAAERAEQMGLAFFSVMAKSHTTGGYDEMFVSVRHVTVIGPEIELEDDQG